MKTAVKRIYQDAFCCGRRFTRWCFEGRDFPTDVACYHCSRDLNWQTRIAKVSDYRNQTTERDLPANGSVKTSRIDLGIDLLYRRARRGQPMTCMEIAWWCGCSRSAIWQIERRAFRKIRKALGLRRDKSLAHVIDELRILATK